MKILPGIRWNNTPINWKLEGEENNEQFIIEPVGQVTLARQSQENLYNIQKYGSVEAATWVQPSPGGEATILWDILVRAL